ncbi:unnamed protein product [Lymnaea stagnalis]|uniref:TNFR-Cys domain-containing protein n=1 Tax=Lymnaea stagnalis TaxID=6523 RepID=A0AAV2I070_LYMST
MSSMAAMLDMFLVGCLFLLNIHQTTKGLSYCEPGPCLKGHYLDSHSNICQPCQHGYYMDLDNHTCHSCFKCMKPEEDHQIIVKPCSADSNAKLGCEDGYFYIENGDKRESGSCEKCSQCGDQCVAVPCVNVTGVVCCSCGYTGHRREPPEASQCARSHKSKSRDAEEASVPFSSQDSPDRTLNDGSEFETTGDRMLYLFYAVIIPIIIVFLIGLACWIKNSKKFKKLILNRNSF